MKKKQLLLVLFTALLIFSCKKNDLAAFQPEIINSTDSFSLQATGLTKVTDKLTYTWSNTGTMANIDQSSAITNGTAILTIEDSEGTEIYSKDLSVDGSFTSAEGVSGNWTITVDFSKTEGDFNFTIQKA